MPKGKVTSEKTLQAIKDIEEEFGEPFWDVVRGFAEDGHSIRGVESILEFSSGVIRRLIRNNGIDIKFPTGQGSLLCKQAREDSRGVCTNAMREALKLANLKNNNGARSVTHKGITDSLVGHAARAGISYSTVFSRMKKSRDPEFLFRPVGAPFVRVSV